MKDRFRLDGRVGLVTGSARGIGNALAAGLIAAGARIWLHDKDPEAGERAAEALGTRYLQADLCCSPNIDSLVETLTREEGRLDILVNNAGIEAVTPFEHLDMDQFDTLFQVNVRAVVELTHKLLPLLKQSGHASIINITSIHDLTPYPNNMAYSMSKAALAMFTKAIAVELAPSGIRVNNLAPGAVMTDINRKVIEEQIGLEAFRQWIPLGRVAQADEMAGPVVFLASDASAYITGATLYADGGYLQNLVRYRPGE